MIGAGEQQLEVTTGGGSEIGAGANTGAGAAETIGAGEQHGAAGGGQTGAGAAQHGAGAGDGQQDEIGAEHGDELITIGAEQGEGQELTTIGAEQGLGDEQELGAGQGDEQPLWPEHEPPEEQPPLDLENKRGPPQRLIAEQLLGLAKRPPPPPQREAAARRARSLDSNPLLGREQQLCPSAFWMGLKVNIENTIANDSAAIHPRFRFMGFLSGVTGCENG